MAVSSYQGEEIIDSITIKQGKKYHQTAWIPRTVFNDPQGKDAYIIGNGESRLGFDLYKLPQDTYGCNALYRDYEPDFLITVDQPMYKEIVESGYDDKNIVYTNRFNMKKYGGKSHLIPHNPHLGTGTTAMHIAILDGHTNLYCIGFDCGHHGLNNNVYKETHAYRSADTEVNQNIWGNQIYHLMNKNSAVNFYFVEGLLPSNFNDLDNCTLISYNELNTHISKNNEDTQSN